MKMHGSKSRQGVVRLLVGLFSCLLVALVIAGCGGGGSSSSGSSAEGTESAETTPEAGSEETAQEGEEGSPEDVSSGDITAQAEELVKLGEGGVVWGHTEGFQKPDTLTSDNSNGIMPFELKGKPKPRTLWFIGLAPTGSYQAISKILTNAAAALGWQVKTVYAEFTPQSYQEQMSAAVRAHPDAIVAGAIPPTLVKQQLAEAKAAGIKTVNFSGADILGPGFDAQIPTSFNVQNEMLGAYTVAESEGTAKAVWVNPGAAYAQLFNNTYAEFLEQCDGCEIKEAKPTEAAVVTPSEAGPFVSSTLQQNPTAEYLLWLFSEPTFPSALAAVKSAGSSVNLIAPQGTPASLEAVIKGESPTVAGDPFTPTDLQVLDVLLRMFEGGKVPAKANEWTAPTLIWSANSKELPEPTIRGIEEWTAENSGWDFLAEYEKAWGVSLAKVFDGVK